MKLLPTTTNILLFSSLSSIPFLSTADLLEDSKLDLSTRNIAMYLDQDTKDDKDQFAWAQGIAIDYQSGYLADFIGFDASYGGAIKLGANDHFQGRNLLRDNNGNAESFNKMTQIYTKLQWQNEEAFARGYVGWRQLHKLGAITISRSRAVTSSYQSVSGEFGYKGLLLRGAYTDRFSDRDSPLKERFTTLSGKAIDDIITGDISYRWGKKNSILAFSGQSQDYLRRNGVEVKWQTPIGEKESLTVSGYWYQNKGLENWEGIPFDDEAYHYNLNLDYQFSSWIVGASYAYTDAKRENGLGMFYWDLGKNTDGNFNSRADGTGTDFNKDGEHMIAMQAMYDMSAAGVPGLKLGSRLTYGFGMEYQGQEIDEASLDLLAMYKFSSVKGLSAMLGVGPGYSYAMDGAMNPVIENGSWRRAPTIGGTFMLDYKFNLL
ncbi:OprD family outer membrane porin [Vibrio sp. VPAP30]|uniref:OprD family outer membrane porin n=1 Tax=Vibrio sp. VPAP30 TaxID=1647102 RepID=UPI0006764B48|nr:OprD family outer membrane porin [Vibrio sp. VPAP30]